MSRRRIRTSSVAALVAALLPAGALAFVCHPDPAGTRTLSVRGDVTSYAFRGDRVVIAASSNGDCRTLAWTPRTRAVAVRAACATLGPRFARNVRLTSIGPASDRIPAVAVLGRSGGVLHRWPLPRDATTVDATRGVAVVAAGRGGVYSVDLRNGRSAYVGPSRPGDRPQIEKTGVVFRDNLYKRLSGNGRTRMKFVPFAGLRGQLAQAGRPLTTPSPLSAIAMDGSRVAVALRDPTGRCDAVYLWNPLWRSFHQLSEERGPTCDLHTAGRGSITRIAIGGSRTAWATSYGGVSTVVEAQSSECQEWVIARLYRKGLVTGLAGDGGALAYAVGMRDRENRGFGSVGMVVRGRRGATLAGGRGAPTAVSADTKRVATLVDGVVELRRTTGGSPEVIPVGDATAIALRRQLLAVLTANGRLEVFDTRGAHGRLVHAWPLPEGVAPAVDLHFGVAVLTAGRDVYAVDVATGRTALLASAPAGVRAQIEAPGVVYGYNLHGKGHLRLIRLEMVLRALGHG